jgi:hypothetical protein
MNKLRFKALEKIIDAQISGVEPYPSKAQIYLNMEKDGLVERSTTELGEEGWILTTKGKADWINNVRMKRSYE